MSDQSIGSIYVHIPFCVRKCHYCDFNSYSGLDSLFDSYVEAVNAEIRRDGACYPGARISTIYFGGGTPTVLSTAQLGGILSEIKSAFVVDSDAEVSIEANPGSALLSGEADAVKNLRSLIEYGFNRLSLGVQTLDPSELSSLGRVHTVDEALQAFEAARAAGFRNISIDLMYGIPEQTRESWARSLDRVIALSPEHVSLYSLSVEEGTPFFERSQAGLLPLPGEDAETDMYEHAIKTLGTSGFEHYEISNFAKKGLASRHNTTYWHNEPYFGFGAGATAFLDRIRMTNHSQVERYIASTGSPAEMKESTERLPLEAEMGETAFLGLRMLVGVDDAAFARRYGVSFNTRFKDEMEKLTQRGLIVECDGFIRLSQRGLLFADEVFAEFVS